MLCIPGYLYGISCESFADFDENGSVIRLTESQANAIVKVSKEQKPIRRRNSFIKALALLPESQFCPSSSSSPQRANRQVPAAVARRKMGNDAHTCI